MFEEAERLQKLPTYIFAKQDKLKLELRKKGADLIDLGLGSPDHTPPQEVIDEMMAAHVIHIIWGNLHLGDQLDWIVWFTGLRKIGDVSLELRQTFSSEGCFQVIYRLQTPRPNFLVGLDLSSFLRKVEVLLE